MSDEVVVEGRVNTSQDGIVVNRGGYARASSQVMGIARKSWSLSRIRPLNTCNGDVCCTLNTRYEDAAIKDYISLSHFPKTCWMYVYENQ